MCHLANSASFLNLITNWTIPNGEKSKYRLSSVINISNMTYSWTLTCIRYNWQMDLAIWGAVEGERYFLSIDYCTTVTGYWSPCFWHSGEIIYRTLLGNDWTTYLGNKQQISGMCWCASKKLHKTEGFHDVPVVLLPLSCFFIQTFRKRILNLNRTSD